MIQRITGKNKATTGCAISMAVLAIFVLAACGGGSGSTSTGSTDDSNDVVSALSRYVMPSEISAVPASSDTRASRSSFVQGLRAMARAALPADSDYAKAETRKYVEEHTLEQFDILEEVLTALNKTHYYDQLGQPAYKAMVVQVGGDGQQAQKTLEPWVVEADIIDADGTVIEPADAQTGVTYRVRVRAWIEEEGEIIKAEFIVSEPPTQNDNGSYTDYGIWTLNVSFGDNADDFFAATCVPGENGESVITLNEMFFEEGPDGGGLPAEVKATMYRAQESGYGKVSYPDWDAIHGPGADQNLLEIPIIEAVYAYNENYLAVQEEGDYTPTYKSRIDDPVEMTHRYGIFDATTGDDVLKTKSFGFPFKYNDPITGDTKRGYYGAWQGRHQIWAGGENQATVPQNTIVMREDFGGPDSEAQTYKVGPTFAGTLVKRTYIDASLDDIKNIPVEIWINQDYQLMYNDVDSKWEYCSRMNWDIFPPQCAETPVDFGAEIGWEILTKNENDLRKQVHINGWDQDTQINKEFVYLLGTNDYGVSAGFYEAEQVQSNNGPPTMNLILQNNLPIAIDTATVNQLWVWIGGQTYVEWNGSQWMEKEVIDFNEQYYKPTFGDNDKPYILPEGRELYINLQGANYVVRKESGVTHIRLELQSAANPSNVQAGGAMDDTGTYIFKEPWAESNSTYSFDIDPNSPTYLMLVFETIGDNDKDQNGTSTYSPGDVADKDIWGIVAYDGANQVLGADSNPLAFNWEYDSGENDWGSVTYLLDPIDESFVLLENPIRFESITATNNAGITKNLALQYDGWMMGLPEMYDELSKNDWVMTEQMSSKIINLAAGTVLTDATDGTAYLLKPLEISQFLTLVSDTTGLVLPDINQGSSISIDTIDIFTAPEMGDMPTGANTLYSEGKLITN